MNVRLRPCHASLVGGDRRSRSGSLAKFTARRASSRVNRLVAERSDAAICPESGRSGSARLAPETTLMTPNRPSSVELSRFYASVVLPDLRLVVQDHVQQRVTDFQFSVVFDIAQFAKFIHEKAHA